MKGIIVGLYIHTLPKPMLNFEDVKDKLRHLQGIFSNPTYIHVVAPTVAPPGGFSPYYQQSAPTTQTSFFLA